MLSTLVLLTTHALADVNSQQIKSGESAARRKAIESIEASSNVSKDVVDALRDVYLTDQDSGVRRAARVALGRINKRVSAKATSAPFAFTNAAGVATTAGGSSTPVFQTTDNGPPNADAKIPNPPKSGPLADLIAQLKKSPEASIKASEQLRKMGQEALPASSALVEVMMQTQPDWHDAQIAATEALEKIYPALQKPVWKIIVERSEDMSVVSGPLTEIAHLGVDGRAALPVVMAYWNAPAEKGFRITQYLLYTMHQIAPKDPRITAEVVKVLRNETETSPETFLYAVQIADQRMPIDKVVELLAPPLSTDELFAHIAPKIMALAESKKLDKAKAAALVMRALESEKHRKQAAEMLGHLGPEAKAALPALKRLKYEDKDESMRKAASEAIDLIDM